MDPQVIVDNLVKICDLLYYEGPWVSLFKSNNDYYIIQWCDVNEKYNTWILFKTNLIELKKYINKEISLKDIVMSKNEFIIVDIDNNIDYHNILTIFLKQLDNDYIPGDKSYYDEDYDGLDEIDKHILKELLNETT